MNKVIPIIVSALIIGGLVYWLSQPQTQTATTGEPLVAVTVPNLSEDEVAGETLFNDNCATCHGKNAAGQEGVAPPLVHKIYEPSHHGDESFQRAAALGVRAHHWRFGNMPPVKGLNRSEVSEIIAYVRELQRANGIF